MWCYEVQDHSTDPSALPDAVELEAHFQAELDALRKEFSARLQEHHERLVKVEASAGEREAEKEADADADKKPEPVSVLQGGDLDSESQEISLGASAWDSCLLVGTSALGIWGSVSTILLILVNISIQGIFCALVFANFLQTEFSQGDLDGIKAWRLRVAHDDRYQSNTGSSLSSRVCGLDPTLELSNEQASKVDLIRTYLPSLDPELSNTAAFTKEWLKTIFDGRIMCLVAVACWVLTVAKEVGSIGDIFCVVIALPSSKRPGVQVAALEDGSAEVTSAGFCSKIFMMCVLTVRMFVAISLLAMGCMYLAYTSSMQDLLLNAVALECVMTVDELVFEALAPRRARQVIGKLAPLKLPPWPRCRAIDFKAVIMALLLVGMLLQVGQGALKEHTDNLITAHNDLCGGTTDFTMTLDGLNMVHYMHTYPFNPDTAFDNLLASPQDLAITELIANTKWSMLEYTLDPSFYGYDSLGRVNVASLRDLTNGLYANRAFLGCHDALDLGAQNASSYPAHMQSMWPQFAQERRVWLKYLNVLPGAGNGQSCADFEHLCKWAEVYALCPVTCKCNSLLGGSFGDSMDRGCPLVCSREVDKTERMEASCSDVSHNNVSDPKWQTFQTWANFFGPPLDRVLLNRSCAGLLESHTAYSLCQAPPWLKDDRPFRTSFTANDNYVLKLFTYLCPETCNCGGRGPALSVFQGVAPPMAVCPDKCFCPWDYPVVPSTNISTCTVPYYMPGITMYPIQTSGKCCYIMQKHSELIGRLLAGGNVDTEMWTLYGMICHTCFSECLEKMYTMQVVEMPTWTYPSGYFLATTGSTTATWSARQAICGDYDQATGRR